MPVSKKRDGRSPLLKEGEKKKKKRLEKGLTSCSVFTYIGCVFFFSLLFFDSKGKEIPIREEDTLVYYSCMLLMYV